LADLLGKAGPVTSRGTSFPELLQARIDLHVEKLGIDDLISLHRSLQTDAMADAVKSLGTDKEKGEAGLVVGMLDRTVVDRIRSLAVENARQSVTARIQEALQVAEPGKEIKIFGPLAEKAKDAYAKLISGGLLPQSDEAKAKFTFGIVKECLAGLSEADVERLLQAVPSQDLKALTAGNSSPTTAGIDQAIAKEVEARTARLANTFEEGVARLVSNDGPNPRTDIKAFGSDLVAVTNTLALVREHADTHGQPIDSKVDEALGRLLTWLDQVPSSRLPLSQLNANELYALHKAFDRLGVGETDQTAKAVREEMERGIAAAQNKVNTATADLAQALQAKDHDATLRALRRLAEAANDKQVLANALGEKFARFDANDYANFTGKTIGEALRKLSEDQLMALWRDVNAPEIQALEYSLRQAVELALADNRAVYEDLFNATYGAYWYLFEIRATTQEILTKENGISLPKRPDDDTEYGRQHLPTELRQGIRNVFGLDIPPDGRIRVISGNNYKVLNEAVAKGIAKPPDQDILKPVETDNNKPLLPVVRGFKDDVEQASPRRIYEFASDGNVRSSNNVAKDQMLDWAVNELRTLTGGNEVQMRAVSLYASQRSLAPLMDVLKSSASPLRLPNGDPAFPGSDYATTKYRILKDPASGDVVIKIDYSVNGAFSLHNVKTDKPYKIDPATSRINFSYEIAVAPDGTARLRGPVSFEYNIEDDRPRFDNDDWLRAKINESAHHFDGVFWEKLHAYAKTEGSHENTAFIIELQAFKQNPSLEKAQQLVDRFIKNGSSEELNLHDSLRRDVLDALTRTQQAGQIDVNMFAKVETNIKTSLTVDIAPRMAAAVRDGRFTV